MEISIKWIVTGIILLIEVSFVVCFYPEYYVEDSCKNGNETIIFDTSKTGFTATLKATSNGPYSANKNCKIVIQSPSDQGIVLSVRKIDFRRGLRYTCEDFIKIYHSDVFESPTTLCHFKFDLEETLSYFTRGPMTIIYHTELREALKYNVEQGFTLTYTSVYLDIQDCMHDNIYMCGNGRCISKDLTCDGRNNCGDRSDESPMLCDVPSLYPPIDTDKIYVLIFAILIFAIVLSGFIVTRYRRRQSADTESLTELDEPTATLSPYEAIHPQGFFICQNPAGPNTLYPNHSKIVHSEGGFTNPCYPNGIPIPPPPYSQ